MIPDLSMIGGLLLPILDQVDILVKFGEHIKNVISIVKSKDKDEKKSITVNDCDDAINLVNPIAQHGGTQTINIINGPIVIPILTSTAIDAREIIESAVQAILSQSSGTSTKQRVSMTWSRLDRQRAKTEGASSPDKGIILEIDDKPHAILFTDELAYLKSEMVDDSETNPMQMVYFVDVDVSYAAPGKVAAYRIVGYHGKDALD